MAFRRATETNGDPKSHPVGTKPTCTGATCRSRLLPESPCLLPRSLLHGSPPPVCGTQPLSLRPHLQEPEASGRKVLGISAGALMLHEISYLLDPSALRSMRVSILAVSCKCLLEPDTEQACCAVADAINHHPVPSPVSTAGARDNLQKLVRSPHFHEHLFCISTGSCSQEATLMW